MLISFIIFSSIIIIMLLHSSIKWPLYTFTIPPFFSVLRTKSYMYDGYYLLQRMMRATEPTTDLEQKLVMNTFSFKKHTRSISGLTMMAMFIVVCSVPFIFIAIGINKRPFLLAIHFITFRLFLIYLLPSAKK